jgi:hypothetical protein
VVQVWDICAKVIKQSIQVGSAILIIHWADIKDNLITFLVGAHDGSITLYQLVIIFLSGDGFIDDKSLVVHRQAFHVGFLNFCLQIIGLYAHGLFKPLPHCCRWRLPLYMDYTSLKNHFQYKFHPIRNSCSPSTSYGCQQTTECHATKDGSPTSSNTFHSPFFCRHGHHKSQWPPVNFLP